MVPRGCRFGVASGRGGALLAATIGCTLALEWLKSGSWRNVVLESDCQALVQAINAQAAYYSMVGLILQDCIELTGEFNHCSLSHVTKVVNKVTDALSRNATASSVIGGMGGFSSHF